MPKLKVKVIANSAKNQVEPVADGQFNVRLTAKALKGQANRLLIAVLADYFGVRKNQILISRGIHSTHKEIILL